MAVFSCFGKINLRVRTLVTIKQNLFIPGAIGGSRKVTSQLILFGQNNVPYKKRFTTVILYPSRMRQSTFYAPMN